MLRCEECDAVAVDRGGGWTAHRFVDPDDSSRVLVVVYCPLCARRELGDRVPPPRPRPRTA